MRSIHKCLRVSLAILSTTLLLNACDSNKKETAAIEKEVPTYVPKINADSAYSYIQKQVDFGPRVPNTKEHVKTGNYLVEKLKGYNWKVEEQNFKVTSFDGVELYLRNIIASYNGTAKKRVLLAAHWDTRPFAD